MPLILLFGADGQVGWELQRSLSLHGEVRTLTRAQANLADPQAVRAAIHAAQPTLIVNAAAYTAVDKAETESDLAFAINAAAPAAMADAAKAANIPLIHYSSDYAYNGTKQGRYTETDATNPLSVYARSKVAGDEAILTSGANAVILRTSWVYSTRGANFVKTILRLAAERDSLRIVSDQFGAPTSAELLADVTARVVAGMFGGKGDLSQPNSASDITRPGNISDNSPSGSTSHISQPGSSETGLFHCTAAGETSWHGFATFIVSEALKLGAPLKLKPEQIEAITTEQYPLPAPRPKNSRLDCAKLERSFGLQLPRWELHVQRALRELLV